MTSFEQAIARGKVEYAEKYHFLKPADIDIIKRYLNYQIDFSENKKQAVIHTPHKEISVTVKE